MKRVRFPFRDKRFHSFKRSIGGLRFDQAEPVADSMNMRVNRKYLSPQREQEYAGGGLKSDSMKRCES